MPEVRTPAPRIAIATCKQLPQLDSDGPRLVAALHDAGADVEVHAWDDDYVAWQRYDAVLVRSTWDYTLRRQEFLAWAHTCRRTVNPADVLTWNTDKHYLQELAAAGVPVVPTVFLDQGEPGRWPWDGDVVVKPAVSASAADTGRYRGNDPAGTEHAQGLLDTGRSVMVQPYMPALDERGETALVYLGGSYSHAMRKEPLLKEYGTRGPVVGDDAASLLSSTTATSEQRRLAEDALAAVPGGKQRLAYARVDMVPSSDGAPVLLELELTEPSLFLADATDAAVQHLAEQVLRAAAP